MLAQTFLGEADEFIEEMEAGLLLEGNPEESIVIDQVFRSSQLKRAPWRSGSTRLADLPTSLKHLK